MAKKKTGIAAVLVVAVVVVVLIVVSMNKFTYVGSVEGGLYFDSDNAPDVYIKVHKNPITGMVRFSVEEGEYSIGVTISRELAIKTLNKTVGGREDFDGMSTSWVSENNDTTWKYNDNYRTSAISGFPTFTSDFISDEVGVIFVFNPNKVSSIISKL